MLDGNDLSRELLLTARQKTKLRNALNNNMSTDINLSKAQISKIIQSRVFRIIIKKTSRSINESSSSFGKNILAPLGITAAASAIDAGIQKKIHGSGRPSSTSLIISNKEMNDIMKIAQALEDSNILLKVVTKTIKNKTIKLKGGFLSMLLSTLGARLLGNLLSGKRIAGAGSGNKKGKGIVRASYGKEYVEIQKY